MPGNIGTADSIVGNLVQAGNIGPPGATMQRGLNVEELERQHFAEGLDALSRRGTMVKDSREFEAAQVVAQEIRQPPQGKFPNLIFKKKFSSKEYLKKLKKGTIGQLHPEHRRALERNKNRNDNRNNRHNQQRRRDPYGRNQQANSIGNIFSELDESTRTRMDHFYATESFGNQKSGDRGSQLQFS